MPMQLDQPPRSEARQRRVPSGLRRLSPATLETARYARQFAGDETTTPGQVLAAFKAAAPFMQIRPQLTHAIDWLFRATQPQDWRPGHRPIVWPSARTQADDLGLSESQVKRLNQQLIESGFITMRDSPTGRRYGHRNSKGQIIEAYGFDLSPLFVRLEEFRAIAKQGRAEREAKAGLRRRASIARNSLRQTWETCQEYRITGDEWTSLQAEAKAASQAIGHVDDSVALLSRVERLETIAVMARASLETALANSPSSSPGFTSAPVDMRPLGRMHAPLITITNQTLNPYRDTVLASNKSSLGQSTGTQPRRDSGAVMKITPDELVRIAPQLRTYLRRPSPSWPDIVEAADWVRHDLGISKPLWGDACVTMGREHAAIAVAIVSAKPPDYFKSTPGGYFHGMVRKARAGELNLSRTIWSLRGPKPPRPA